jgi:cytochrome c5
MSVEVRLHAIMRAFFTCVLSLSTGALMSFAQTPASAPPIASQRAVIDQYCVTCHNQKLKTAGFMLDQQDLAHVGDNAEVW